MYEPIEVILTEDELRAHLVFWQRHLRLQDWDIKVVIVRASGMTSKWNSGEMGTSECNKECKIEIMHPEDFQKDNLMQNLLDMEYVLVHELVHIHFEAFKTKEDTGERMAEEQAVNALSKALVGLRRSGKIAI